jgi:hypothetical protein
MANETIDSWIVKDTTPVVPQVDNPTDWIVNKDSATPDRSGSFTIPMGSQGISQYDDEVNPNNFDNVAKIRANNQSAWDKWANFAVQSAGEIVGGSISGIGAIGGILEASIDKFSGQDADFKNFLTDLGDSITEGAKESNPIYAHRPDEHFAISDLGWWLNNGTSVFSTLSLMVPGVLEAKGAGVLAEVLTGLAEAGKVGDVAKMGKLAKAIDLTLNTENYWTGVIHTAVGMRNAENFQEAGQVHQQTMQDGLEYLNAMPDEEFYKHVKDSPNGQDFIDSGRPLTRQAFAEYSAAKAGWRNYEMNAVNLVSDIMQVMPLFKGYGSFITKDLGIKALEAQAKVTGRTLSTMEKVLARAKPIGTIIGEASGEFAEESINAISQSEGNYYGKYLLGKEEYKDKNERLREYLSDPSTWEQGFWGFVGGVAFSQAAHGINKLRERGSNIDDPYADEKRASEITGRQVQLGALENIINTKVVNNNINPETDEEYEGTAEEKAATKKQVIKNIRREGTEEVALNALRHGNFNSLIEQINSDEFSKTAVESGVSTKEEIEDYKKEILQTANEVKDAYTKYYSNIFSSAANPVTKQILINQNVRLDNQKRKAERRILQSDIDIANIRKNDPFFETTGYKDHSGFVEDSIEENTLGVVIDAFERLSKSTTNEFEKRQIEKKIKDLREKHKGLVETNSAYVVDNKDNIEDNILDYNPNLIIKNAQKHIDEMFVDAKAEEIHHKVKNAKTESEEIIKENDKALKDLEDKQVKEYENHINSLTELTDLQNLLTEVGKANSKDVGQNVVITPNVRKAVSQLLTGKITDKNNEIKVKAQAEQVAKDKITEQSYKKGDIITEDSIIKDALTTQDGMQETFDSNRKAKKNIRITAIHGVHPNGNVSADVVIVTPEGTVQLTVNLKNKINNSNPIAKNKSIVKNPKLEEWKANSRSYQKIKDLLAKNTPDSIESAKAYYENLIANNSDNPELRDAMQAEMDSLDVKDNLKTAPETKEAPAKNTRKKAIKKALDAGNDTVVESIDLKFEKKAVDKKLDAIFNVLQALADEFNLDKGDQLGLDQILVFIRDEFGQPFLDKSLNFIDEAYNFAITNKYFVRPESTSKDINEILKKLDTERKAKIVNFTEEQGTKGDETNVYVIDLANIPDRTNDKGEIELSEAQDDLVYFIINQLQVDDNVTIEIDVDNKDGEFSYEKNKDNADKVPLKISVGDRRIAYYNLLPQTHGGVQYTGQGTDVFDEVIKEDNIRLLQQNFKEIYEILANDAIYKANADIGTLLLRLVNVNRENKIDLYNKTGYTPEAYAAIQHILKVIYYGFNQDVQSGKDLVYDGMQLAKNLSGWRTKILNDIKGTQQIRKHIGTTVGKKVQLKVAKKTGTSVIFAFDGDTPIYNTIDKVLVNTELELLHTPYNTQTSTSLSNITPGRINHVSQALNQKEYSQGLYFLVRSATKDSNGNPLMIPVPISYNTVFSKITQDRTNEARDFDSKLEKFILSKIDQILSDYSKGITEFDDVIEELNPYITTKTKNDTSFFQVFKDADKIRIRFTSYDKNNLPKVIKIDKKLGEDHATITQGDKTKTYDSKDMSDIVRGMSRSIALTPNDNKTAYQLKYSGEFTDFTGKKWDSYQDFAVKTGAIITNMGVMVNSKGEKISNISPRGSAPLVINISNLEKERREELKGTKDVTFDKVNPSIAQFATNNKLKKNYDFAFQVADIEGLTLHQELIQHENPDVNATYANKVIKLTEGYNRLTKASRTRVLTHEIIHGLIRTKIGSLTSDEHKAFLDDVEQLYNHIKTLVIAKPPIYKHKGKIYQHSILDLIEKVDKKLAAGNRVGLEELITEGLTNDIVYRWLNKQKITGTREIKQGNTIWNQFVDVIRKFLRLIYKTDTLVDEITQVLNDHSNFEDIQNEEDDSKEGEGNIKKRDFGDATGDDIVAFSEIGAGDSAFQKQSEEGQIATEKTIRDLAARLAHRIGMSVKFEANRNVDYKGKVTNGTAYINLAHATLDTPVHEILGHPIIRAIRGKDLSNIEPYFKYDIENTAGNENVPDNFFVQYSLDQEHFEVEFFNTIKEVNDFIDSVRPKKVEHNIKPLYKNLLRELEEGRGKEVLDRIKRDYDFKWKDGIRPDLSSISNYGVPLENFIQSSIDQGGTLDDVIADIDRNYMGSDGEWMYFNRGDYTPEFYGDEGPRPQTTYQEVIDTLYGKKNVPYTLEEQQEEAIVELLGLMTAEKLDAVKDGKLISLLKRLLKEIKVFMKELLFQKEVEIDKLPDNMTLGDLSDLLAYSNNKLILPGNEVEYTTPDNNKFKTWSEARNHVRELAKNAKDIDLSNISVNDNSDVPEYFTKHKYAGDRDIIYSFYIKDNKYYKLTPGEEYEDGKQRTSEITKKEYIKESENINGIEKGKKIFNNIKDFIERNKPYERAKEVIEEWKKVNDIVYDPEEVYSRGQGFYSVVGAYSSQDINLLFQNLLHHIEDSEKAGGEFTISAYTKPIGKTLNHLEGGGGKIKFVIYPKSEDIKWASNTDVYSGSVWDASNKISKDKKSELLGVSYSKYPSLDNLRNIKPNLADAIDRLKHHHNELGITINNNFRLEADNDVPYTTKKLIDVLNGILDNKFGKLTKPKTDKHIRQEVTYDLKLIDEDGYEKALIKSFKTLEEAEKFGEINKDKYIKYSNSYKYEKVITENIGIQPTKTNDNLKESIDSIKRKVETKSNDYQWFAYEIVDDQTGDSRYSYNDEDSSVREYFDSDWLAQGEAMNFEDKPSQEEIERRKAVSVTNPLYNSKPKEYHHQALVNLKIAALKETAKKYPLSLIRSEVKSSELQQFDWEDNSQMFPDVFQKLSKEDKEKNEQSVNSELTNSDEIKSNSTPEISSADEAHLVNILASTFIASKDSYKDLSIRDIRDTNIKKEIAKKLYDQARERDAAGDLTKKQATLIEKALDNLDEDNSTLWNRVRQELSNQRGIYITDLEDFRDEYDNIDIPRNWDDRKQFEEDYIDRVSLEVKDLFNTTKKHNFDKTVIKKNGTIKYVQDTSTPTGFAESLDWNYVSPYIMANLLEAHSTDDMLDKLFELGNIHDKSLLAVWEKTSADRNLANALFATVNMQKPKTYINFLSKDDVKTDIANKENFYEYFKSNDWIDNIKLSKKEGVYNEEFNKEFDARYNELVRELKEFKSDSPRKEITVQLLSELFELIGVNISEKSIKYNIESKQYQNIYRPELTTSGLGDKEAAVINNLYKKSLDNLLEFVKHVPVEGEEEKEFDEFTNLRNLATTLQKFDYNNHITNNTNVKGNQRFAYVKPNYISNWFKNKANDAKFEKLLRDHASVPANKYLEWLWNTKEGGVDPNNNESDPTGFLDFNVTTKDGIESRNIIGVNKKYKALFDYGMYGGRKNLSTDEGQEYSEIMDNLDKLTFFARPVNATGKHTAQYFLNTVGDAGDTYLLTGRKIRLNSLESIKNRRHPLWTAFANVVAMEIEDIRAAIDLIFDVTPEGKHIVKENLPNSLQMYKYIDKQGNILKGNGKPAGEVFVFHYLTIKADKNGTRANGKKYSIGDAINLQDYAHGMENDLFDDNGFLYTNFTDNQKESIRKFIDKFIQESIKENIEDNEVNREFFEGTKDRKDNDLLSGYESFDHMIAEYALNDTLASVQMQRLFGGNTNENPDVLSVNKRGTQFVRTKTTGDNEGTYKGVTVSDIMVKSPIYPNNKKGINTTDGFSVITLKEFERRTIKNGTNGIYKDLIAKLKNGEVVDFSKEGRNIQSQKDFDFGYRLDNATGTFRSSQVKNSTKVLIPNYLSEDWETIRRILDKDENIGMQLNFVSAVKVGAGKVVTIHDKNGNLRQDLEQLEKELDDAALDYYYEDLGIQQNEPDHAIDKVNKAAVQLKKFLDNIFEDKKYRVGEDSLVGKEARRQMWEMQHWNVMESSNILIDRFGGKLDEKQNPIFDEDGNVVIKDRNFATRLLREQAEQRGANDNIMFNLTLDPTTGQLNLPLYFGSNIKKTISVYTSLFTNNVTRETMPGQHLVLQPTAFQSRRSNIKAFELTQRNAGQHTIKYIKRIEDELASKGEYKLKSTVLEGKNVIKCEVVVPIWDSRFIKDGNIIDINDLSEEVRTHIGYRIPLESKHSMVVFEVVGFITDGSSSIILPDEFIEQSGGDFDIDTLYTIIKNIEETKEGFKVIPYSTKEDDLDTRYERYIKQFTNGKFVDRSLLKELHDYLEDYAEIRSDEAFEAHTEIARLREKKKETKGRAAKESIELDINLLQAQLLQLDSNFAKDAKAEEVRVIYDKIVKSLSDTNIIPTREVFKTWSIERQNSKQARQNRIFDTIVAVINNSKHYQELIDRSHFEDISAARNRINDIISGEDLAKLNPIKTRDKGIIERANKAVKDLKGKVVARSGFATIAQTTKMYFNHKHTVDIAYTDLTEEQIDILSKKFKALFSYDKYEERGIVRHNMLYSTPDKTHETIKGKLITYYTSQIPANVLDAVQSSLPPFINDYTIGVFENFVAVGVDSFKEKETGFTYATNFINQDIVRRASILNTLRSNVTYTGGDLFRVIADVRLEYQNKLYELRKAANVIPKEFEKDLKYQEETYKRIIQFADVQAILGYDPSNPPALTFDELEELLVADKTTVEYLQSQLYILEQFAKYKQADNKIVAAINIFNTDKLGASPTLQVSYRLLNSIEEFANDDTLLIDNVNAVKKIYPNAHDDKDRYFFTGEIGKESVYKPLETYLIASNLLSIKTIKQFDIRSTKAFEKLIKNLTDDLNNTDAKRVADKATEYGLRYLLKDLPFFSDTDIGTLLGKDKELNLTLKLTEKNFDEFQSLGIANQLYLVQKKFAKELQNTPYILNHIKPNLNERTLEKNGYYKPSYRNDDRNDNVMIESFRQLYYSKNYFLNELGRNLIKYAFQTDGLTYKFNSYSKLIPSDILKKLGVGNALTQGYSEVSTDEFVDFDNIEFQNRFRRANSYDRALVPLAPDNDTIKFTANKDGIIRVGRNSLAKQNVNFINSDIIRVRKWNKDVSKRTDLIYQKYKDDSSKFVHYYPVSRLELFDDKDRSIIDKNNPVESKEYYVAHIESIIQMEDTDKRANAREEGKQLLLFDKGLAPRQIRKYGILFENTESDGYTERTKRNADETDATLAFAYDFSTAGEVLTKKVAKNKYLDINLNKTVLIKRVVDHLNILNAKSINIAGNGVYTLSPYKMNQNKIDAKILRLLREVVNHPDLKNKITSIRTGGQTGVDEAGAKAGRTLGITTHVLMPLNFLAKNEKGTTIKNEKSLDRFAQDENEQEVYSEDLVLEEPEIEEVVNKDAEQAKKLRTIKFALEGIDALYKRTANDPGNSLIRKALENLERQVDIDILRDDLHDDNLRMLANALEILFQFTSDSVSHMEIVLDRFDTDTFANDVSENSAIQKDFSDVNLRADTFLRSYIRTKDLETFAEPLNGLLSGSLVMKKIEQFKKFEGKISDLNAKRERLKALYDLAVLTPYSSNPLIKAGIVDINKVSRDLNLGELYLGDLADTENARIANQVKRYIVQMDLSTIEANKGNRVIDKVWKDFTGTRSHEDAVKDYKDKFFTKDEDGKSTGILIGEFDMPKYYAARKKHFKEIEHLKRGTLEWKSAHNKWMKANTENVVEKDGKTAADLVSEMSARINAIDNGITQKEFNAWKKENIISNKGEFYFYGHPKRELYEDKRFDAVKDTALYKWLKEEFQGKLLNGVLNNNLKDGMIPAYSDKSAISTDDNRVNQWLKKVAEKAGWYDKGENFKVGENDELLIMIPISGLNLLTKDDEIPYWKLGVSKERLEPEEYEQKILKAVAEAGHGTFKSVQEIKDHNAAIRKVNEQFHGENIDYDFPKVMKAFNHSATKYKYKMAVLNEMIAAYREIDNMDLLVQTGIGDFIPSGRKTNKSAKVTKKGVNSNLKERMYYFLKMVVAEDFELNEGTWTKLARVFQTYTSFRNLTLNVTNSLNNVTYGRLQILVEEFGAEHWDKKDAATGEVDVWKGIWSVVGNLTADNSKSLQEAFLKEWSIAETQDERYNSPERKFLWRHLISTDSAFIFMHMGEYYMQNKTMFTMINSHRIVNGDIMSFTEHYNDIRKELLQSLMTKDEQDAMDEWLAKESKKNEFKPDHKDYVRDYILRKVSKDKQDAFLKKVTLNIEQKKKEFKEKYKTVKESFELDSEGFLKVKDGIEVHPTAVSLFKNKILQLNKGMHGAYSELNANMLQHYALGRLGMQFHKFIYPGWTRRFGAKFGGSIWNEGTNSYNKGYYTSAWEFITKPFSDAKRDYDETDAMTLGQAANQILSDYGKYISRAKVYWYTLDEYEKANVIRAASEMLFLIGVTLVGYGLKGLKGDKDDPEEKWALNFLMYQQDRLRQEFLFYLPVYGWISTGRNIIQNPIAAEKSLTDLMKLMAATFMYANPYADESDRYYKGGLYDKELKIKSLALKTIPGVRSWYNLKHINNQYFKLFNIY